MQILLPGNYFKMPAYILFFFILLSLSGQKLAAQDNTMYLMPDIPQANQLNPAYMKLCRIYVELPVISSVKVNIRNTGFGFHDVITRNRYSVGYLPSECIKS